MSIEDLYDDAARERVVAEPPKRVDAPVQLADHVLHRIKPHATA